MYAPLPSALKPARVLFLSRKETSVSTDVKALRAIGASSFTYLADTASALAFLRQEHERVASVERITGKKGFASAIDIIVCDEALDDGPISIFLYALAKDKSLRSLPVLVLTGASKKADALRALKVFVLERPYAVDELEHTLQRAMSPMRQILRAETLEQAAAAKRLPLEKKGTAEKKKVELDLPVTASDWYVKGMGHLKVNELSEAEYSFRQTLSKNVDHVDAAIAMAKVQRDKGNEKGMRRHLLWAAASSSRLGDHERAQTIAAKLPEGVQKDVFFYEAVACMQENRYRQAAINFLDAGNGAEGKPLHSIVARASLHTTTPDVSLKNLCDAFDGMGQVSTANILRKRLLNYQPFEHRERSTWLDNYPFIKEVVSVVSYTTWVWKRA